MPETALNIEALKQLRRVVEAAPDDRLHMRTFCEEADCGTAYCAAGWAAIDPWFRENTEINGILEVDDDGFVSNETYINPFRELGQVFGLNHVDSQMLFGAEMTPSDDPHAVPKAEVLANIDRLLAGEHARPYKVVFGRLNLKG